MQSVLILGRQPQLGIAELESLYGASALHPAGNSAAVLNVEPNKVDFDRLGGSIKLAKLLTELPTTHWDKLIRTIAKSLPKHITELPEGKLKLGISTYGLRVDAGTVSRSALFLKKSIKSTGRSVRIVPNNEPALGSAQVIHNQLTSDLGMELLLIRDGDKTILAQTVAEQDIEAYGARDQGRPKRDAKVGMLPPKLAQIIINLTGLENTDPAPVVLDPFCGTGVVLQEAQLMGFGAYGTDLEQRMIDYSEANIEWLQQTFKPQSSVIALKQGDAAQMKWDEPFSVIAGETYLGRPFSAQPDPKILQEVMQDVNYIHKKFLQNVTRQTESGFRMCIAVPAWHIGRDVKRLKVLDNLEELGYNRIEFVHAGGQDLIYHREGQIVGRELVVLVRK